MKTNLIRNAVLLGTTATLLVGAPFVSGAEAMADREAREFKGTLVSVDSADRTLSVKSFWRTRTFNLADDLKVALEDKADAALSDLRPGQKVAVAYHNADGVLIARQINQQNLVFKGRIAEIDPKQRTLAVKHTGLTRYFAVSADCTVKKQGSARSLDDLKVGQIVSVVYEPELNQDSLVARRIEQQDAEFVGVLRAIDAEARTVRAKSMLDERKFNLTDDCQIVILGRPDARLKDLRIGDRVAFSYEAQDGVLIANRIGLEASAASQPMEEVHASAGNAASRRDQNPQAAR
jgi:Cu/Ag efflux protein CusF